MRPCLMMLRAANAWIPELDCVTGALALAMDVTDAAMIAVSTVDAYNAASTGDWAGAAGDVAAFALAGAGGEGAAGGVSSMNATDDGVSVYRGICTADGAPELGASASTLGAWAGTDIL
jgi:hypothetical protein